MPLRDHFRPPLDDLTSWEGFHGQWPAMIVQQLNAKLPRGYVAEPRVHLGSAFEIDVAAYESGVETGSLGSESNGGAAAQTWSPTTPTLLLETDLPERPDGELPWAAPEPEPAEEANVLPFEPVARAA